MAGGSIRRKPKSGRAAQSAGAILADYQKKRVPEFPAMKPSADVAAEPFCKIVLSKQAALLSPELAAKVSNPRLTFAERMIAAQNAEAMAVALAQPHRRGSDDPRLAFPLGR